MKDSENYSYKGCIDEEIFRQRNWCDVSPQSTVSTIPQLLIVDNCGLVWTKPKFLKFFLTNNLNEDNLFNFSWKRRIDNWMNNK